MFSGDLWESASYSKGIMWTPPESCSLTIYIREADVFQWLFRPVCTVLWEHRVRYLINPPSLLLFPIESARKNSKNDIKTRNTLLYVLHSISTILS